ncbi:MAG: hypothetical protein DRR11_05800 [Gammaproteobacteria bacterium]|nr:MAG: hypothetical protein DRQ59_12970 [Gammaproteobacteria bacterium]RLA33349.1 MAG: hypothetical protein DRR11_05800 [Gammaproteobacteria bacterium]
MGNDDKLTRFAKKVLAQGGYSEGEKQRLQQELTPFIAWLDNYIENNYDGLATAYGRLDSPKWQAPLPPIDQDKAAKGKALFAGLCVSCHGIRDEDGQFPMTNPNPR